MPGVIKAFPLRFPRSTLGSFQIEDTKVKGARVKTLKERGPRRGVYEGGRTALVVEG